jgi:hypothetical protein
MSFHNGNRQYQRQEAFALQIEKNRTLADHGRGMEELNITRCGHCERPTIAEEHIYTPQRAMFSEDHDRTYFTCEWCGSEVTPRAGAPRKPAQAELVDDRENLLRTA